MELVRRVRDVWGRQKPAGKAAVAVIVLLAQCCICILPFTAIRAVSGAQESVEAGRAVEADVLGGGSYIVGTDIWPGLYRGEAGNASQGCAWARLGDAAGTVIEEDRAGGPFTIRVLAGDYALRSDCALIFEDGASPVE